jgi:hypothetical protein
MAQPRLNLDTPPIGFSAHFADETHGLLEEFGRILAHLHEKRDQLFVGHRVRIRLDGQRDATLIQIGLKLAQKLREICGMKPP